MGALRRGVKNSFRNVVRTVAIVAILGLSIGLAVAMLMARGAVEDKISVVKSSIGNTITISPAGARGFEGGGEPLTDDELGKVSGLPHVTDLTKTLNDRLDSNATNLVSAIDAGSLGNRQQRFNQRQFSGSGGSGNQGNFLPPIQVVGSTNIDTLAAFGGGATTLVSGDKFDVATVDHVALIGKALADKNNLAVGSTFTAYGQPLTVKGIFDSGNQFSNNLVVLPLTVLQTLSDQAGQVSSAIAQVDSIDNLATTTDSIKQTLGSAADVVSAQDTSDQALQPLEGITSVATYSVIGAIGASAAIIMLTMVMIVRERRREIGVLKAIGAATPVIALQFMAESMTLTALGLVVGIGFGALAGGPITQALVRGSAAAPTDRLGRGAGTLVRFVGEGVGNLRDIQSQLGGQTILLAVLAALLIAAIGSIVSVLLSAKVRPAEVMRAD